MELSLWGRTLYRMKFIWLLCVGWVGGGYRKLSLCIRFKKFLSIDKNVIKNEKNFLQRTVFACVYLP